MVFTVSSDFVYYKIILKENRDLNKMNFHVNSSNAHAR